MGSFFQLPDELVVANTIDLFPCREAQIRTLATLFASRAVPCRNVVLHGTEATGKSSITEHLLRGLAASPVRDGSDDKDGTLRYAAVNSIRCITSRHLFESTLGAVADALDWDQRPRSCETVAQLAVELTKMLKYHPRPDHWRFILAFDSIDRQRDAAATLLPALARLSEIIPSLTCVFITTSPPAGFLRISSTPHVHFPNYNKAEFVKILSPTPPENSSSTLTSEDLVFLWPRFCNAVHDALTSAASRTLPSFRRACNALWPRFIAPILAGTHGPREFSKLVIAARVHFQDESLLNPSIVSVVRPTSNSNVNNINNTNNAVTPTTSTPYASQTPTNGHGTPNRMATTRSQIASSSTPDLAALLPTVARLLLVAAYLASHNATKHDLTLFSTYHHGRRKRRGGGFVASRSHGATRSKHRKISRKLLGAHAFVLERVMAIFAALRHEWAGSKGGAVGAFGLDGDVAMAVATLASLRLLVRVGATATDTMDRGGKWRVNVGWEVIRGVGRSIGIEVEEWLID